MFRLKIKKIIAMFALTVFLSFCFTGCSLVGSLNSLKEKFNGSVQEQVFLPEDELAQEIETTVPMSAETKTITLYFSDIDGQLVAEQREIPKVEGIARQTVEELIKGPTPESGLQPTIPIGTELKDINVKDTGLAIVDFNNTLVESSTGNGDQERVTVYSIVNTLTQFPTIQEVQILVDGKKIQSIAGSIDVFSPISRDDNIIK